MSGSVSAFRESDGEKRRALSTASAQRGVSVLRAVARRSEVRRDAVRVFETSSTLRVARRCRSRVGSRASPVRAGRIPRKNPESPRTPRGRDDPPGTRVDTYRLAVLSDTLTLGGVRGENRPRTLTLSPDNAPHPVSRASEVG